MALSVFEVIAAIYVFLGATAFGLVSAFGINAILGAIAGFGSAVLIVVGIVLLFDAYGMFIGTTWAWWLGIIVAGLLIVSVAVLDVAGFAIGIIMAYYLTRPKTKKWFRM